MTPHLIWFKVMKRSGFLSFCALSRLSINSLKSFVTRCFLSQVSFEIVDQDKNRLMATSYLNANSKSFKLLVARRGYTKMELFKLFWKFWSKKLLDFVLRVAKQFQILKYKHTFSTKSWCFGKLLQAGNKIMKLFMPKLTKDLGQLL